MRPTGRREGDGARPPRGGRRLPHAHASPAPHASAPHASAPRASHVSAPLVSASRALLIFAALTSLACAAGLAAAASASSRPAFHSSTPPPTSQLSTPSSSSPAPPSPASPASPASTSPASSRGREQEQQRAGGGEEKGEKKEEARASLVRGRAVYEETGRPVRRGRVRLYADMGENVYSHGGASTLTDARGAFEFKDVDEGRYLVAAEVPGALTPGSFSLYPGLGGSGPIDFVKARQYFAEVLVEGAGAEVFVQVRAVRGAAVSGRVTFENGDPAVGATVSVQRKRDGHGSPAALDGRARRFQQAVDDRGLYRVTGLPPGEYLVSVAEELTHGAAGNTRTDQSPISAGPLFETFHPSTTLRREAAPVVLAAGEERAGVDVTVVERGLRTITGTVVARKGRAPVSGARVSVVSKEGGWADWPFSTYFEQPPDALTDAQGRFTLREVPDGDHVIIVNPVPDVPVAELLGPPAPKAVAGESEDGESDGPPASRYAAKLQEVRLDGRDLEGVTVELGSGFRIVGTVATEGATTTWPEYMPILAVTVEDGADGKVRDYKQAVVWGGRFVVAAARPGKVYLAAHLADARGSYYVKSITAGGRDLLREPLKGEEGGEVSGVRVVIGEGAGRLEGRVFREGRERTPAGGAELLLVSVDEARWMHPMSREYARADWSGAFKAHAAPGEYFIVPLTDKDDPLMTERGIRALVAGAKRVTLRAGQAVTVEVELPAEEAHAPKK